MSRPRKIQDELQGRQDQDKEVRCLLPKRTRKEQRSQVFEEDVERIFWEAMKENNSKLEDFAAKETKEERSVSSSIDVERIFWKGMKENNWKQEDFAAEETKEERSVSSSIDVVHSKT